MIEFIVFIGAAFLLGIIWGAAIQSLIIRLKINRGILPFTLKSVKAKLLVLLEKTEKGGDVCP